MPALVPAYIVEQLENGRFRGEFDGAALFVDISGFTAITNSLMEHGQHGAEVLAQVMRRVFEPIVHAAYSHGGFVAYFAGDALTALFPEEPGPEGAARRALAAAQQIQQHLTANSRQETLYGAFTFSAKVGAATGLVDWGILRSADHRRAAYYFRGPAITDSAEGEKVAQAGDIILSRAMHVHLQEHVATEPVGERQRVKAFLSGALPVRPVGPPPASGFAGPFVPPDLTAGRLSGEFRQVYNLFINLRGNPDRDEIAVFMDRVFELQNKYGGMLNRIDFGDKGCHLLLFWGAPLSYENDAARATSFALELREASALTLRMGLTFRISHAGYIGSSLQAEYTCYGNGVNLAARLMTSADWDEILLDANAGRKVEHTCRLTPLGARAFKGFADKVPVFRLERRRAAVSLPTFGAQFVGREQELRRLGTAFRPLAEGRFAGVAAIVGEPGMGKSYLAHEFLRRLPDPAEITGAPVPDVQFFYCQTDEILRESLNPFRYWLRRYFRQAQTQGEAVDRANFEHVLAELLRRIPADELSAELYRGRSMLGALVGLHWADSLYEQLQPELRFENMMSAAITLIRVESRRRPTIILLEDAHWLDPDSGALIRRLLRNAGGEPLALLLTSRDEPEESLLIPSVPQTVVRLERLEAPALAMLARRHLNGTPSDELLRFLAERTDGNPLFVEHMLQHLSESGLLTEQAGEVVLVQREDSAIPDDVRALLVARLDRLPPAVRDVVQEASVLGREFEQDVLARMTDRNDELEAVVEQAEQAAVWQPLGDRRYAFRHALMREAAYRMQLRSRRHALHLRAAQAFEHWRVWTGTQTPRYAEVAYHYDQAGVIPAAVRNYGLAGEQAGEEFRNDDALTYFTKALALAPPEDNDSRLELLLGREAVLQRTGMRARQQADLASLEKALAGSADLRRTAEYLLRHSAYSLAMGDYEGAVSDARLASEAAAELGDGALQARALHRRARTLWPQGQYTAAGPLLEQARQLATEAGNSVLVAECLYDLSVTHYYAADYAEARRTVGLAREAFAREQEQMGELRCLNLSAVLAGAEYRYAEALAAYRESLELCRSIGWRYGEATVLGQIGNAFLEYGAYEEARAGHEQALRICRDIGYREGEIISLDTIGLISHYQGALTEAKESLEAARVLEAATGNPRSRGYILTHLGYLLAEMDEPEAAEQALSEALVIRQGLHDRGGEIDTTGGLALAALARGDIVTAGEHADRIASRLKGEGTDGLEFPGQLYLICYQVLCARAGGELEALAEANRLLDQGHTRLLQWANSIPDESLRQRYLNEVPYHRALREARLAVGQPADANAERL